MKNIHEKIHILEIYFYFETAPRTGFTKFIPAHKKQLKKSFKEAH